MSDLWGVLAEFETPEALVAVAAAAREAGLAEIEAFTPFPVDGLAEALGFRENRIPWLALGGGIAGAGAGYGMQVWANLAYPIDIGGRPAMPPQAFGLITFELTVLGAVLAMILGLFLLCRLPKLSHPLFSAEPFERATVDGFFLLVPLAEGQNDKAAAEAWLIGREPRSITEVRP